MDRGDPCIAIVFHTYPIDIKWFYSIGVFFANLARKLAAKLPARGARAWCTVLSTGDVDKAESPCTTVTCVIFVNLWAAMTRN
jgi:hypothetical protein